MAYYIRVSRGIFLGFLSLHLLSSNPPVLAVETDATYTVNTTQSTIPGIAEVVFFPNEAFWEDSTPANVKGAYLAFTGGSGISTGICEMLSILFNGSSITIYGGPGATLNLSSLSVTLDGVPDTTIEGGGAGPDDTTEVYTVATSEGAHTLFVSSTQCGAGPGTPIFSFANAEIVSTATVIASSSATSSTTSATSPSGSSPSQTSSPSGSSVSSAGVHSSAAATNSGGSQNVVAKKNIVGPVAGGVVGAVVLIAAVGILLLIRRCSRRRETKALVDLLGEDRNNFEQKGYSGRGTILELSPSPFSSPPSSTVRPSAPDSSGYEAESSTIHRWLPADYTAALAQPLLSDADTPNRVPSSPAPPDLFVHGDSKDSENSALAYPIPGPSNPQPPRSAPDVRPVVSSEIMEELNNLRGEVHQLRSRVQAQELHRESLPPYYSEGGQSENEDEL